MMSSVDLRSDTVTKPTPAMHAAMMAAEVGDDVLGEDPTVSALEQNPETALVALENTMNKGGGACYSTEQIAAIHAVCQRHGLPLHLDGARVFNALVATREDPTAFGRYFSSISVCLSKGLGAPVGSVLLGSKELIRRARRVRKVLGGGMRQAGYLAAAGIYALDHHVERLTEDHRRAAVLAEALATQDYVQEVLPVETNIVIFTLREQSPAPFVETLKQRGVLAIPFGKQQVRMVTHLEVTDAQVDQVIKVLRSL